MNRLEFAARLIVIYIAGALGAINANGDITAPFALLSIFLTAELAARKAGRLMSDRITRIGGSVLVALVVGGVILNFTPEGLTRQTWSAFWVVVSLAVLWWRRRETTSFAWLHKKPGAQTAWFGASAAVLLIAFVVAVQGANKQLENPLQMWVAGKSTGSIAVAVSSGKDEGPFRFVVTPEVTKTDAFDPFSISPGAPIERSIPVGGSTRYDINLVDVKTGEVIRTVIVDSLPIS
jgi:hypothetical protein